ncbi:MAG: hypoxanthine phosphoribosyltransferase [Puniceicoccales bacterium]|jgi:hypoxanthine phosphoribosyltransferase|nr:hypoxanthine phosphoribosyltransferase [Puniceicoccales bacterium]
MPNFSRQALNLPPETHPDVETVLFPSRIIAQRVASLGGIITNDYTALGAHELTLVGIANGAVVFMADLLRQIRIHTRIDTVRVSSYQDADSPVTHPQMHATNRLALSRRHILLVDDILDTGNTLAFLKAELQKQAPASLRTCVLLDKKGRRQAAFDAEYTGFVIPDVFVVGYGLDFAERYRNLPFVGVLKRECQNAAAFAS